MITFAVVLVTLAALSVGAAAMAVMVELTEQRQQTDTLARLADAFQSSLRLPPPRLPSTGRSRS